MPDILHARWQKLFTAAIKSAIISNAVKVEPNGQGESWYCHDKQYYDIKSFVPLKSRDKTQFKVKEKARTFKNISSFSC